MSNEDVRFRNARLVRLSSRRLPQSGYAAELFVSRRIFLQLLEVISENYHSKSGNFVARNNRSWPGDDNNTALN